jgi:hypothetical protein
MEDWEPHSQWAMLKDILGAFSRGICAVIHAGEIMGGETEQTRILDFHGVLEQVE